MSTISDQERQERLAKQAKFEGEVTMQQLHEQVERLTSEVARLQAELVETSALAERSARAAHRLQHGKDIEGDHVCPFELRLAAVERVVAIAREADQWGISMERFDSLRAAINALDGKV